MSILWERRYILHFPLPLYTKDTEQEIPGDALQSWRILHSTNWLKSSKTRLREKLQWIKWNNWYSYHPLPGSIIESCIKVLVPFQFVNKILKCDHPNESYWAAVSCGIVYVAQGGSFESEQEILKCDHNNESSTFFSAVYDAVKSGSNFWVTRQNPWVWPFILNPFFKVFGYLHFNKWPFYPGVSPVK